MRLHCDNSPPTKEETMRIHWLQHVPFEGLGRIEEWGLENGHELSCTRLYKEEPLPRQDEFQVLVIMGGPMGVHDDEEHPWLSREKAFIQASIQEKKPVIGICLGAQLLALVMGAQVRANLEKEIGWFPVRRADSIPESLVDILPVEQVVFHWHGDTFSLPDKAVRLYSSAACENQAFVWGDRVIGLQFHLETTPESVALLSANCGDELVEDRWIQREDELAAVGSDEYITINKVVVGLMDYLVSRIS